MLLFQHPEYLLALVLVPVLIILYAFLLNWKRKAVKRIGDEKLVRRMTADFSSRKFLVKFSLFTVAVGLCAVALAGLASPDGTQKVNRRGIDLVFALDVSKSMLAQDIKPSRLDRAKQVISNVINQSPDDRIGLVVFAGRAYLQMPITVDHAAARMYLSGTSPDDIPTQGTVISQALKMSGAAFNPKDKTYKAVILLSDGEDHDKDAIKTVKQLKADGIIVNTIGIGSPQGAPINDPQTKSYKRDENGDVVISKLNEEELIKIAQAGGGIYQHYNATDEVVRNLLGQLSNLGETTITDKSFDTYRQYFQIFLAAAFLLLLVEFFISERRRTAKKVLAAGFALIIMTNSSIAQDATTLINKGNTAYKSNNFDKAGGYYSDAQKAEEGNEIATYNLGNVNYRQNKTDEAVAQFDETIKNTKDNSVKQKAYYNKGVTYQRAEKLPECILAYKNALLLDPNDEEARQNLQRALQQQKQQDQNKKDKQDQKKKQDQKQDQKKEDQPKPQPSKITKQDAEEKLKSLLEQEKALQDKLHKVKGESSNSPEKDW